MKEKAPDLVLAAMFLAAGIILQAVETLYLPPMIIPGAKFGLANSITLIMIVFFGFRDVVSHIFMRVTAVSLITGTFMSTTFFFSLAGGLASGMAMLLCYRFARGRLSFVGISLIGAVTHNLAQLATALLVLGHPGVILLLPWLLFVAVPAGVPNGLLVNILEPRLSLIRTGAA